MRQVIRRVNLYPDGNAFYLKQKLAAKLGVTPSNLVLGNGSNEIIELLAMHCSATAMKWSCRNIASPFIRL